MKLFVIQKHDTAVLRKDLDWTCDLTSNDIFYSPHRDIALNQLVELNAKQIDLRVNIIECEADANGRPVMQLNADNVSQIEAIKSEPSAA
jgi:hypothetical protein